MNTLLCELSVLTLFNIYIFIYKVFSLSFLFTCFESRLPHICFALERVKDNRFKTRCNVKILVVRGFSNTDESDNIYVSFLNDICWLVLKYAILICCQGFQRWTLLHFYSLLNLSLSNKLFYIFVIRVS